MAAGGPRRAAGRALQVLGLVLLPLGLWLSVAGGAGMGTEISFLAAGAAAFLLGRALAGR